jgi:S1-C subfamily serine protease
VKSHTELRNAIGLLRVGEKVEIALLRDAQARKVTALIEEPKGAVAAPAAPAATDKEPAHRGLTGAALVDAPEAGGVLVRSVAPGSAAAAAGLRADDVILAANRARVANLAQLREAAKGAASLVLNVRRGGRITVILLR